MRSHHTFGRRSPESRSESDSGQELLDAVERLKTEGKEGRNSSMFAAGTPEHAEAVWSTDAKSIAANLIIGYLRLGTKEGMNSAKEVLARTKSQSSE